MAEETIATISATQQPVASVTLPNNLVVILNLPQTPLLTLYTTTLAVTRHSETLLTYSRTVTTTNHALEVAKNVGKIVGKGAQLYR